MAYTSLTEAEYQRELTQQNAELRQRRKAEKLPALNRAEHQALQRALPFSGYRMLWYAWDYPGARTDEISQECAIGNPSDVALRCEPALINLGLSLWCEKIRARNRYGQRGTIGIWWVAVADAERWQAATEQAAA